jgi:hypothetical protein
LNCWLVELSWKGQQSLESWSCAIPYGILHMGQHCAP